MPTNENAPHRSTRSRSLHLVIILAVISGCFGCDQVSKNAATALLRDGHRISLLGDCLRLERAHNSGAFLGLGANLHPRTRALVFTWGVGLLVCGALAAALHYRGSLQIALGAALIAGGGLGNLYDRVSTGGWVRDFLNLGVGPVRTGIFNAADVAIMLGVALLALSRRPAQPQSR